MPFTYRCIYFCILRSILSQRSATDEEISRKETLSRVVIDNTEVSYCRAWVPHRGPILDCPERRDKKHPLKVNCKKGSLEECWGIAVGEPAKDGLNTVRQVPPPLVSVLFILSSVLPVLPIA
jgi:hypothetical protein